MVFATEYVQWGCQRRPDRSFEHLSFSVYEMKANKKFVQESVRLDTSCKKGRDKAKGWTIFERRANEDENFDTF